jgi:hypothetical protein
VIGPALYELVGAVVGLSSTLAGLAAAGVAAILALAFVRTALWALALVAAATAAAAAALENGMLPLIVVGGLIAGVGAGFSPVWWRAEQLSAERHRDVLPAPHRDQLASASWWYPERVAATTLTLSFPAAVVVACIVVARWSLQGAP